MNDRQRFGVAFVILLVGAATASHFWALDDSRTALGALFAAVVVSAALLVWRRNGRPDKR